MKYDFKKEIDINRARARLESLIESKSKADLTKISLNRSISQNSYIHVLFALFGIEFGNTLDESKKDLKDACHFMNYEKNGNIYNKRTRDLNTQEMTDFIDWVRTYSSQKGCYLPTPDEYRMNKYMIDNEITRHKEYL